MLNISHGFLHFHQVRSKYDGIGTNQFMHCIYLISLFALVCKYHVLVHEELGTHLP